MQAKEFMTSGNAVRKVRVTGTISEVAAQMREHKVSAVPVVNEGNHVVGIVSERDLLQKCGRECTEQGFGTMGAPLDWMSQEFATHPPQDFSNIIKTYGSIGGTRVDEIMTKKVVTAGEDAEVMDLLITMAERQVNHIPIVDSEGRLTGIVARGDVITALGRRQTAT